MLKNTFTKLILLTSICLVWSSTLSNTAFANDIKPGQWLVGTEIKPGLYRTTVANCYWERLKGFSGSTSDIIDNGHTAANGGIVEIFTTDKAFSSKCAWLKQATSSTQTIDFNSIKPGQWLVGTEIKPGLYRTTVANCYWERLKGFSGSTSDIIDNGHTAANGGIVEIFTTDKAFSSKCAWLKQATSSVSSEKTNASSESTTSDPKSQTSKSSSTMSKAGKVCKRINSTLKEKAILLTCKKSNGKLVWTLPKVSTLTVRISLETGFAFTTSFDGKPSGITDYMCTSGQVYLPRREDTFRLNGLGAKVKIVSGGEIVALGNLDKFEIVGRDLPLPSADRQSGRLAGGLCVLSGEIANVPKRDFYTVFIDDQKGGDYSFSQMQKIISLSRWN